MKIDITLSDDRYFHLAIGNRILIKDLRGSKGEIPVYSANVQKAYGYTDKSNITDFSHDYVLWGIDGKFLFNIKHKGEQFATTDHCGTIKILEIGGVLKRLKP